jgi:hypothetical protein
MLRGNPQIGELIEVPAGPAGCSRWGLIRRLWHRYDLALIAQYSDRAHLYGAVAARRRSGLILKRRATDWWKRLLLDHAVVVDENQTHAVIEKLRLLGAWAGPPGPCACSRRRRATAGRRSLSRLRDATSCCTCRPWSATSCGRSAIRSSWFARCSTTAGRSC